MTHTKESSFKDYLFATYDIPTSLVDGFVMQSGTYTGRINIKIYIPGENEFISFTIRSAIELGGLTAVLEKSNKIYSLHNFGDKLCKKNISV